MPLATPSIVLPVFTVLLARRLRGYSVDHACTTKELSRGTWRIESQGLLKDPLQHDNLTPIPASSRRRLDEPPPASGH